jgi:hypothetical protein
VCVYVYVTLSRVGDEVKLDKRKRVPLSFVTGGEAFCRVIDRRQSVTVYQ